MAEDPKSGEVESRRVLAAIDDGGRSTTAVGLSDGGSPQVTPNHPSYVDGGPGLARPPWLAADSLRAGDRLRPARGRDATVVALRYHT